MNESRRGRILGVMFCAGDGCRWVRITPYEAWSSAQAEHAALLHGWTNQDPVGWLCPLHSDRDGLLADAGAFEL